MNYLFFLGHPAHYHLFKNLIIELQKNGHQVKVIIKTKDILENLCNTGGLKYENVLPENRKNNTASFVLSFIKKYRRISKVIRQFRPHLLLGSEPTLTHLGKIFHIPSFVFSEDDAKIIFRFAKIAYPFVDVIMSPKSCNAGKWEYKKIGYNGFHKLAYLHPSVFTPDKTLLKDLVNTDYFILRFAELSAYHDKNKTGIHEGIAKQLIEILEPHGKVYITSERVLEPEFEKHRLTLDSKLIHHALYFARLYIGDSQSMAVEAALLGTPGIRFNDFSGEIGVLNELEYNYNLTYSYKTNEPKKLFSRVKELLADPNSENDFKQRRLRMLQDKINVPSFFQWFIENYPESKRILKSNPDYPDRFK